jgi:hypothetical protein
MTALTKTTRTAVAGLVAALALATGLGAADLAQAAPNNGGGTTQTTCKYGGTAGEERTFTVETYLNGKLVRKTTVKKICGNDGKWHTVGITPGAAGAQTGAPTVATGARS